MPIAKGGKSPFMKEDSLLLQSLQKDIKWTPSATMPIDPPSLAVANKDNEKEKEKKETTCGRRSSTP